MKVVVIIPAFNEEDSIAKVLSDVPADLVQEVIVVDNDSTDKTAVVARDTGATVVTEPQRGYGKACLSGIDYAKGLKPDVVVFMDGDYSDYPQEAAALVRKIEEGYDMVIGSRVLGKAEKGALLPQARWGNWLAVCLIKMFFGYNFTDLGPFRALRWSSLLALNMQDEDFGWTVEMQVKAARLGLNTVEIPVSYRKRIGVSKVTGTISGTIRAGYKILYTIFKYAIVPGKGVLIRRV